MVSFRRSSAPDPLTAISPRTELQVLALGTTRFDETGQTQIPVEVQIKEVVDGAWVDRSS